MRHTSARRTVFQASLKPTWSSIVELLAVVISSFYLAVGHGCEREQ